MIMPIITNRGAKKMCLAVDSKISNENDIFVQSYQKMLIKFIDLILHFSINNTKLVIKCQAEFLCIE